MRTIELAVFFCTNLPFGNPYRLASSAQNVSLSAGVILNTAALRAPLVANLRAPLGDALVPLEAAPFSRVAVLTSLVAEALCEGSTLDCVVVISSQVRFPRMLTPRNWKTKLDAGFNLERLNESSTGPDWLTSSMY